jgi:heat-inducible transcriptional repressor
MSFAAKLSERHQHILWATIRHYIATAEPVGSKTLAQEYDLKISSATIRNILGRLEKSGLLYQPHTSAGRIPSDFGYRIYVDRLIEPDEKLGKKLEQSLSNHLNSSSWSFEDLLQRAAQIMANLSGYIALITMPQTSTNQLKHLQLVQVSSEQVMLIIVTDSFQTQSILMELPEVVSGKKSKEDSIEGELQIISNFLNSKLKGRSLLELANLDWSELDREFKYYADFCKTVLQELSHRIQLSTSTPIMVRGLSEVLRQPEFSQIDQVQTLLHLLEKEQEKLWPIIFELPEIEKQAKKFTAIIGSENPLEPMRTCTLIVANYHQDEVPVGSVGIIGPTRMLYENTIALVESTADYLSEALS